MSEKDECKLPKPKQKRPSYESALWALAVIEHGSEITDKYKWSVEGGHLVGRLPNGEWKLRSVL